MGGPLDNVDGYISTVPQQAATLANNLVAMNYERAEAAIDGFEQLLEALRMDLEVLYERYPGYDPRSGDD